MNLLDVVDDRKIVKNIREKANPRAADREFFNSVRKADRPMTLGNVFMSVLHDLHESNSYRTQDSGPVTVIGKPDEPSNMRSLDGKYRLNPDKFFMASDGLTKTEEWHEAYSCNSKNSNPPSRPYSTVSLACTKPYLEEIEDARKDFIKKYMSEDTDEMKKLKGAYSKAFLQPEYKWVISKLPGRDEFPTLDVAFNKSFLLAKVVKGRKTIFLSKTQKERRLKAVATEFDRKHPTPTLNFERLKNETQIEFYKGTIESRGANSNKISVDASHFSSHVSAVDPPQSSESTNRQSIPLSQASSTGWSWGSGSLLQKKSKH